MALRVAEVLLLIKPSDKSRKGLFWTARGNIQRRGVFWLIGGQSIMAGKSGPRSLKQLVASYSLSEDRKRWTQLPFQDPSKAMTSSPVGGSSHYKIIKIILQVCLKAHLIDDSRYCPANDTRGGSDSCTTTAPHLQRAEPTSNVLLVPFELEKEKYLMPELFVGI